MADETFEAFIARERVRLTGEREAIKIQQQELKAKLVAIARELTVIDAYETAYGTVGHKMKAPPIILPPFDAPEL
jgi:hypothetical protein